MTKHIIITEEQLSLILKEEAGIAEAVKQKAQEIYDIIKSEIARNEAKERNDFYTYEMVGVEFDFIGNSVKCSASVYNFFTRDYYNRSHISTEGWSTFLNKEMSLMGVVVPCISGTVLEAEAKDSIQHELEHLYQQIMMGKMFSRNHEYAGIRTNLESSDAFVRDVANLIYGCIKSEQEGFVNGMYSYLMALPQMATTETLKLTPAWKQYAEMVEIFNRLVGNPDFIDELKKYHMTERKVQRAIENFLKRIGKVYNKVRFDKMSLQGWRS